MPDRNAEIVGTALEAHRETPGALLPILHDIQDRLGHVPGEAIPAIAKGLNLSRADVHGVITFYHHFRSATPGRHVVRICRAEACQSMGAEKLAEHARKTLGVEFHGTTKDKRITLEAVYCLGNCACAPAMMVSDGLHGRVTPERFDAIVKALP